MSSSTLTMASRGNTDISQSREVTIDSWLKDLRMECYRRNLEGYSSFQSLLFAKDADLKKAGILNARDRTIMINSLSTFSPNGYSNNKPAITGFGSRTIKEQHNESSSRSLLKKGMPMKKLKGFLGGNKGKKVNEVQITSPNIINETEVKNEPEESSQTSPSNSNRHSLSLEDLIKSMEVQQHPTTVENDYVPDPQSSPQFAHIQLKRANTVSEPQCPSKPRDTCRLVPDTPTSRPNTVIYDECSPSPYHQYHYQQQQSYQSYRSPITGVDSTDCGHLPENDKEFDHLSPKDEENFSFEDNISGTESSKHLSVVSNLSTESGLGLTCEPEDNSSLGLEEQPWFHGQMNRSETEYLLRENGDFLVHEDPISNGVYTLSLLWEGRHYHLVINCDEVVMKGVHGRGVTIGYKYQFENGAFDTVPELIYNHLRYHIPVSRDLDAVIRNPVSSRMSDDSSKNRTLPKNFYSLKRNRVMSPEHLNMNKERNNSLFRSTRSASFSPADSPRGSPIRDVTKTPAKMSSSSSIHNISILSDIPDEDEASDNVMKSMYCDVPDSPVPTTRRAHVVTSPNPIREDSTSPPNVGRSNDPYITYDVPVPSVNATMRPRAKTESVTMKHQTSTSTIASDLSDYQQPRPYDPDDYEEMRSVSVFDTFSPSPVASPKSSPKMKHRPISTLSQEEHNQYAFLTPKGSVLGTPTGPQPGVKYAEISFNRSKSMAASDYSSAGYPHSIHGKSQSKVTYVTTKLIREEVSNLGNQHHDHPLATHLSIDKSAHLRPKTKELPRQSSMDLLRLNRVSTLSKHTKIPKTIQEIPGFLKDFTNEEIAAHLTKADSVCFLLSPRPAEDNELWSNRVQEVAADGVFVGLQILASSAGLKLWKKLFHRHLSLSQLVILCIIQVPDSIERAKVLKKWIELSHLLQSGTYGNLFSFMAIMKGLESPQIKDLTRTWELLKNHFSDVHDLYQDQLKGMISALMQGVSIYAIDGLTVPAIQHLKKLYSEEVSPVNNDMQGLLEDFTTRVTGLDGLRSILKHTADLSANAKRRLSSYSFDAVLFDFFMQDVGRMHLQNMGTSSEDPLERYRRFNIVLDSLFHKLESP